MSVSVENRAPAPGPGEDVLFRLVGGHYLESIGAHLLSGRLLADSDDARGVPVVVVNEAFVRQYLDGRGPLGIRVNTGTGTDAPIWMTIVGIVADVRERGADLGAKPAVYVPFAQTRITFFQPSELAIRTTVSPASIGAAVQRAVWSVDPEQPVVEVRTLSEVVDLDQATRWRVLSLLAAAAALALALAAFGIYSVLSYIVSGQRPELAVRLALGASRSTLVGHVMRQTAVPVAWGVLVGVVAAALATRLLGSLLFGVSPLDLRMLALATMVLVGAAGVAAYLPARRAALVDPLESLRVR